MKKKNILKIILTNFDVVLTGATLTLCVILVNANVIMRYFFNSPLQWCDEVVTSLFVWTVFLGSAYAHRKHSHLGVDIVVNLMHGKLRETVTAVMSVVELLVLIMLTAVSAQYVYNLVFTRGVFKLVLTDTLRIPKVWTGIAVPIGFGLSTIYSIYFLIKGIIDRKKPKTAEEEGGDEQ